MSKIEIALRSKAFWSLAGVFIVQGLTAILPDLHGNVATIVQSILALIAIYQHPTEIQTAGSQGTVGGVIISRY